MVTSHSKTILFHQHKLQVTFIKNSVSHQPTLVFLHDALGSIAQWRGFPEKLAQETGLNALVYDRLGYGKSDENPTKRDINYLHDYALKELPAVLNALHINDVILVGHSDGGSIALIFAGSHHTHIKTSGLITEAAHVFVEEITLAGINDVVISAKQNDFVNKLKKFHGNKAQSVFDGWHKTWFLPEFKSWNIEGYLANITCPSLIIQGMDDEYGTKAQVEAITRQIKGPTQSLIIPNCAHVPHYQAPEATFKAMCTFIKKR
ncbi:alpha/beta hydrolase [bacterium]|nr:alpha/beta hydrolase [bacterium]